MQVTDSRGCTVIDNLEISENSEIISQLSSTPTTCFGSIDGTATIFSTGGTGDLTFTWSNGESTSSITSGFGNYWVIVEDELGCISVDTILINQPQKIRTELIIDDVNCFGGWYLYTSPPLTSIDIISTQLDRGSSTPSTWVLYQA